MAIEATQCSWGLGSWKNESCGHVMAEAEVGKKPEGWVEQLWLRSRIPPMHSSSRERAFLDKPGVLQSRSLHSLTLRCSGRGSVLLAVDLHVEGRHGVWAGPACSPHVQEGEQWRCLGLWRKQGTWGAFLRCTRLLFLSAEDSITAHLDYKEDGQCVLGSRGSSLSRRCSPGWRQGGGWGSGGTPRAVVVCLSRRLKCSQILCLKALILMNICVNEMQIRHGLRAPGTLPMQP